MTAIIGSVREALFALAGTALGILGTLVTDMWRGKRDDLRERRQRLRDTCADFTVALARMRQAHWGRGYDEDTRRAVMHDAHDEARAQYERLPVVYTFAAMARAGSRAQPPVPAWPGIAFAAGRSRQTGMTAAPRETYP